MTFQRFSITTSRRDRFAEALRNRLAVVPWVIDSFTIDGDEVEIRGWAIPPDNDADRVEFRIDGKAFPQVRYPLPREDIKRLFWFLPGLIASGYVCRGPLPNGRGQDIAFEYTDRATGRPVSPGHSYFFNRESAANLPVPEAFRRRRVHGGDHEGTFLLEGYTTYRKLARALETTLSRRFPDFPRILDWGCGCGRMTRFFHDLADSRLTGADIDADNVAWCRENLGFGEFLAIPTHPPTQLDPASQDLIIGISIFTHLSEPVQLEWLGELQRISAPGAILLLTIHADATVCRAGFTEANLRTLDERGFLDIGLNPNLDDVESIGAEADYYRNTFHTHEYIHRVWSRYFEIVRIIPAYIGNHQDLVILRRP